MCELDIDIDIEDLFNVEYDKHRNTSPVGSLLRQTKINITVHANIKQI